LYIRLLCLPLLFTHLAAAGMIVMEIHRHWRWRMTDIIVIATACSATEVTWNIAGIVTGCAFLASITAVFSIIAGAGFC
jgi:hypothetical protein